MTTLLLVRHAATALTAQHRFSGSTGADPELSAVGEEQAARVAARLARRPGIAAVVCSPAARTRRTAAVIAAACNLPVEVEPELREVDFGAWEGRTGAEVAERWPAELAAWRAGEPVRPPGGETVEEVGGRVAAVLPRFGGTVVLVSHMYPIRTSVADALGAPRATIHRMRLDPTGLTEIRDRDTLVRYNDAAHLD
jgi:probable phosphoglycerate mutase